MENLVLQYSNEVTTRKEKMVVPNSDNFDSVLKKK